MIVTISEPRMEGLISIFRISTHSRLTIKSINIVCTPKLNLPNFLIRKIETANEMLVIKSGSHFPRFFATAEIPKMQPLHCRR